MATRWVKVRHFAVGLTVCPVSWHANSAGVRAYKVCMCDAQLAAVEPNPVLGCLTMCCALPNQRHMAEHKAHPHLAFPCCCHTRMWSVSAKRKLHTWRSYMHVHTRTWSAFAMRPYRDFASLVYCAMRIPAGRGGVW